MAAACAATLLLGAAGDSPDRLRSEAAWAHLCGTARPASSGKVTRHRLNWRRPLKWLRKLYRIAIVPHRTTTYCLRLRPNGGTEKDEPTVRSCAA